jgi:hypothetical protein
VCIILTPEQAVDALVELNSDGDFLWALEADED